MADEEGKLPPEVEEGGQPAPEEQQQEEIPTPSVEDLAKEAGWTPKEEFKGNPEKWKPAHEYLLNTKNTVKNLSRELKDMRDQVGRMSEVSQTLLAQQLADRDAYWQGKYQEAVETGNVEAANVALQQRELLQYQVPPPPQSQPHPAAQAFRQRNPWFGTNPLASQRAWEICETYARANYSQDAQIQAMERQMRKEFPELFTPPAKQPPEVNAPDSRRGGRAQGGKGFNDLPAAAKEAAVDFEKNQGVPKEEYARLYFKRQEKVG